MIREYTIKDKELLAEYLGTEPYGKAIFAAIEEYGSDKQFQTVYVDIQGGEVNGVYLWLYKNLLIYCRENKVDIDFLEQMLSVMLPDLVAGRKDNVNIVSWLLTDYEKKTMENIPQIKDDKGETAGCFKSAENGSGTADERFAGEWDVLFRSE